MKTDPGFAGLDLQQQPFALVRETFEDRPTVREWGPCFQGSVPPGIVSASVLIGCLCVGSIISSLLLQAGWPCRCRPRIDPAPPAVRSERQAGDQQQQSLPAGEPRLHPGQRPACRADPRQRGRSAGSSYSPSPDRSDRYGGRSSRPMPCPSRGRPATSGGHHLPLPSL